MEQSFYEDFKRFMVESMFALDGEEVDEMMGKMWAGLGGPEQYWQGYVIPLAEWLTLVLRRRGFRVRAEPERAGNLFYIVFETKKLGERWVLGHMEIGSAPPDPPGFEEFVARVLEKVGEWVAGVGRHTTGALQR